MSNQNQGGAPTQWDNPDGRTSMTDAQIIRREAANSFPVATTGAAPQNFAQMMDYAQQMSRAGNAIPQVFSGNVGACLAVMEIANQFGMPYFATARQSYFVNGQIAFMGQLVHAILRLHAPIKKAPAWRFEGSLDDGSLKIFFYATFKGEDEPKVYESPRFDEIATKNSPLWKSKAQTEVEQQLIYFGARRWQSRYWPEGMLGVYVNNEFEEDANGQPMSNFRGSVNARVVGESGGQGLLERLRGAPKGEGGATEGYTIEGSANEIGKVSHGAGDAGEFDDPPGGQSEAREAAQAGKQEDGAAKEAAAMARAGGAPAEPSKDEGQKPEGGQAATADKPKAEKKTARAKKPDLPKNATDWAPYCRDWIDGFKRDKDAAGMRKQWAAEQKLRNAVGVTSAERDPVFEYYNDALIEIEGDGNG